MTRHLPEEERRSQILQAARRCFVSQGYFTTRMEDIARQAGLSKGGVYFHFAGKRELFEALVREEYRQSMDFLKQVSGQPRSYIELFESVARHFLNFFQQRPDYPRFLMVMGEMAGRDESIRRLLADLQQQYTEVLAGLIRQGVEAGALRPVDERSAAIILKGIIDAVESYMALGVPLDVDRLVATGMDLLKNGLSA